MGLRHTGRGQRDCKNNTKNIKPPFESEKTGKKTKNKKIILSFSCSSGGSSS
jgi:hypothetical protein